MRQLILLSWLYDGLVDPRLLGQARRSGPAGEPLGGLRVSAVEGGLPTGLDLGHGVEVDRRGGVHADPGMAMLVVVGGEEPLTERTGIGQGFRTSCGTRPRSGGSPPTAARAG